MSRWDGKKKWQKSELGKNARLCELVEIIGLKIAKGLASLDLPSRQNPRCNPDHAKIRLYKENNRRHLDSWNEALVKTPIVTGTLQKVSIWNLQILALLTRIFPLLLCFSTLPFVADGKAVKFEIPEVGHWLTVILHFVVTREKMRSA